MKRMWSDPDSIFNSPEYRKKLRDNMSYNAHHHIVPRSLGGKKTFPLSRSLHAKVEFSTNRRLLERLVGLFVPEDMIDYFFTETFKIWYVQAIREELEITDDHDFLELMDILKKAEKETKTD